MQNRSLGRVSVRTEIEHWPLVKPFRISGYTFEVIDVLVVALERDGHVGRGEAAGVYYKKDAPIDMLRQIEAIRSDLEAGIDRPSIQRALPCGGARNALDCAFWDLESKIAARPVWEMAGVGRPRPLLTTFTCGVDDPERMIETARSYAGARALKLKLNGDGRDAERVRAIRDAFPDVWLGVDANQGFTRPILEGLMPVLLEARVSLIEQPFPVGQEAWLDGFRSPIPLAADESVQGLADISRLGGRFNVINIKLDKCGGLTEGLAMARAARDLGMDPMVGNMIGTSLAMAPAFVLGQLCEVVDLDGPVFLRADRQTTVEYQAGSIACPEALWG